ncbi:hypothetical protein ECE50_004465 [Chitinophaga sp. Mgbs1]|uniref:NB-ARC domain-containing protein n=1 Tax=Chitinophaga solisilvae TaxID=1233460 RepID=A0A9Q5D7U8_9BACT|nr:hypothetical protein [Chitinophaga solisilvae]
MKDWILTDAAYDEILWERVWKKASGNNNVNPVRELMYGTRISQDDEGISRAQLQRYIAMQKLKNPRNDTRDKLACYLEYRNYQDFKTAVDAEMTADANKRVSTDVSVTDAAALVRYTHLSPEKPDCFIGRDDMLTEIHAALSNTAERRNVLLLSSMGGMGKTTVLHEYLNSARCKEHFERIIYVSVNKNLERGFVSSVARSLELNLTEIVLPARQLEAVLYAMKQQRGNNLAAIDNVNESDFEELQQMQHYFRETGWKILITTRTQPDEFDLKIEVDELEMKDALQLFMHYYVPDSISREAAALMHYMETAQIREETIRLLEHIGRHTLVTELLAKTGKKKGIAPSMLLKHLREEDLKHPELALPVFTGEHASSSYNQRRKETMHKYMLSIFDTTSLQVKTGNVAADKENREKVIMLHFFSVLPPVDIPVAHLKKLWGVPPAEENTFENRLDELRQIGWIKGKQEPLQHQAGMQNLQYKMHPLIQEIVYEKLKPDMHSCAPLIATITAIFSGKRQPEMEQRAYQQYSATVLRKLKTLSPRK